MQALNEMQHISDSVLMESKTRHLRGKINKLWSKLMSLEMQLVDQLEVRIDDISLQLKLSIPHIIIF